MPSKYLNCLHQLFIKIYAKILSFFKTNSIIQAELLLLSCSTVQLFLSTDFHKIKYKFYPELMASVKIFNKCLGTPINKYLTQIRKLILSDLKYERKIINEKNKTIVQSFFLVVIMISFISLYRVQMNLHFSNMIIIILVSFQLFGVWIVNLIYNYIKQSYFNDYTLIYQTLYTFKIRLEVGGSIQKILEESYLNKAYSIKMKILKPIIIRLEQIIIAWQHTGSSINGEIMEIITEVNFRFEESLDSFLSAVIFLRFISLVFFFLLPFLGINLYFFSVLFK